MSNGNGHGNGGGKPPARKRNPYVLSDEVLNQLPGAARPVAKTKTSGNPFVLDDETLSSITEVKKKDGGNELPTSSPSASPLQSKSLLVEESPSTFLMNDVDQAFSPLVDLSKYGIKPLPNIERDEQIKRTKLEITSNPKHLANYTKNRIDQLRKDIDEIGKQQAKLKVELYSTDVLGGPAPEEITDEHQYNQLKKQASDKEAYIQKLKENVADIVTDIVLPQEDLTSFDPKIVGRKIITAADPELESKFKMVEAGGGIVPGIRREQMERLGLNAAKKYLNKTTDAPNRDRALAYIESLERDFDERNVEMTGQRVREKIGAYFYKKGNSGFFGNSQQELQKAIDDPETGLTESEKRVAKSYVLPIEAKVIGTEISGSGFFRSFRNAAEKSIIGTSNTILDAIGQRGEAEQTSDLLSSEVGESRFRAPGENPTAKAELQYLEQKEKLSKEEEKYKLDLEKYVNVRDGWSKFKDGVGDLTGQVAWMAVGTKGIGAIGKAVGASGGVIGGLTTGAIGSALRNETVGLFLTSYLNSYDNYKKQAIDLIPGIENGAERDAYAKTMAAVEGLSEKLFADTKILKAFTSKLAPSVQDITQKFINKEITQQVAKEELQGAVAKYMKPFGKEFSKSTVQESTEEAVVDVAEGIAASVFGGQDFDIVKTGQQALNTFVTTAMHSPLIAGMAAHGAYRTNRSQNAFMKSAIMNMAQNPGAYIQSVEDLQLTGQISQPEANEKMKLIKSAVDFLREMPPSRPVKAGESETEQPFDFPQATAYVLHRMNEGLLQEKIEKTSDEVDKSRLEKELKRSQEIRKGIYTGSVAVTPDIQEVTKDPEKAKELGIQPADTLDEDQAIGTGIKPKPKIRVKYEDVEQEQNVSRGTQLPAEKVVEATEFANELVEAEQLPDTLALHAKADPLGFFKTVAQQAQNVDADNNPLPHDAALSEQATRDTYGDTVVNFAKELYPVATEETIVPETIYANAEEQTKIRKPEIPNLSFIPVDKIVNTSDPVSHKRRHDDIKNRFKETKKLIDCIWS